MSRDLTDVLHHGTDRLPLSPDGPAAVRRRAETARRRRRGAAAVAAVAALSVAAGSVLLGGGSSTAPPPADIPTPEPSVLDQAADIGLDRFLQPTDLPSSPPFAPWTGSWESRDMVGQPSCTTMAKGTPQSSRLVELTSRSADVRGYQAVASYPSIALARDAAASLADSLTDCKIRLPAATNVETGSLSTASEDDGYHLLSVEGATPTVELLAHARVGTLVSVVWLTSRLAGSAGELEGLALLTALSRRLSGDAAVEEPTRSPDAQSSQAPSLGATTTIPPGFAFAEQEESRYWQNGNSDNAISRSLRVADWALAPCTPTTYPSDAGRTDMVTVSRSGPEFFDALQVAVYADGASASRALVDFRVELARCADTSPDVGTTHVLWTVEPLDVGAEGLLAVARYEVDGQQVPGSTHAAAYRVGHAVFLRLASGEGFPPLGRPDATADLVTESARANRVRLCSFTSACEFALLAGLRTSIDRVADTGRPSGLPLAAEVAIGLAGPAPADRARAALSDRAGWVVPLPPEGFRELCCTSVSAVALLAESHGRYAVTTGAHPSCASPVVPPPPVLAGLRQVSVQPTGIDSCLDWWSVDLYLDEADDIRGVIVDLGSP